MILAVDLGYAVVEAADLARPALPGDEVFVSGTAAECIGLRRNRFSGDRRMARPTGDPCVARGFPRRPTAAAVRARGMLDYVKRARFPLGLTGNTGRRVPTGGKYFSI